MLVPALEPDSIYNASNVVHRSTDGGQTFTVISPDLTGGAESRRAAGSAGGGGGDEFAAWPTITSLEESHQEKGVLWAGTDDGIVQLSRDGGANWKNITPKDMPKFGLVDAIETSPHTAGRAFLAVTSYRTDDYHPYVFRTDDYGQTWTLLTSGNGIPANHYIRVVREDPVRKGLLYAGGEFGMYVSFDDGRRWQSLQLNMPVAPISDLAVSQGDLAISTNGRSFWILDDVTPLRELAANPRLTTHLFAPRDTYRIQTSAEEDDDPYVGGACCVANVRDLFKAARIERHQLGEEPPDGAIVYASFAKAPTEPVSLSILNGTTVVRTVFDTSKPSAKTPKIAAGLNRFNWDLRADPLMVGRQSVLGRKAVPGSYQVKLTIGSEVQTAPLKLLMDPRLARAHVTSADLQKQHDLLAQIDGAIAQAQKAAAGADEAVRRELVGTGEGGRGGGGRGGPQPIVAELVSLHNFIAESEDKPTAAAVARWTALKKSLDEKLAATSPRR